MTDLMDYLPKLFVQMLRSNFFTIKELPYFLLFSLLYRDISGAFTHQFITSANSAKKYL